MKAEWGYEGVEGGGRVSDCDVIAQQDVSHLWVNATAATTQVSRQLRVWLRTSEQ